MQERRLGKSPKEVVGESRENGVLEAKTRKCFKRKWSTVPNTVYRLSKMKTNNLPLNLIDYDTCLDYCNGFLIHLPASCLAYLPIFRPVTSLKLDLIRSFPHFKSSNDHSLQMDLKQADLYIIWHLPPFLNSLPFIFSLLCCNQVSLDSHSMEDWRCWCPAVASLQPKSFQHTDSFLSLAPVFLFYLPEDFFSSLGVGLTSTGTTWKCKRVKTLRLILSQRETGEGRWMT